MRSHIFQEESKIPDINVYAFNPGLSFADLNSIDVLRKAIKENNEKGKSRYSIKNYIFRNDPISRESPIKLLFYLSLQYLMTIKKK